MWSYMDPSIIIIHGDYARVKVNFYASSIVILNGLLVVWGPTFWTHLFHTHIVHSDFFPFFSFFLMRDSFCGLVL